MACKTLKLGRGHFPSAVRGQIALWMLTKFAMVFFILLLAGIMVGFSDVQKTSICKTQAQSMARNIAATLTNVINSPVEDERKVFALESSLSVGKAQLERYTINVTNIPSEQNDGTGSLVVHVLSGSGCEGYARASYDRTMVLVDPAALQSKWKKDGSLLMYPSNVTFRDYYLIMAKCQPKQTGYSDKKYIYMKNCAAPLGTQVNPDTQCPPYLSAPTPTPDPANPGAPAPVKSLHDTLTSNPVLQCCGWEALSTDPATGANDVTNGVPKCPA